MLTIRDVQLETVCGITSALPVNTQAEVAFAGRSNVGKSSLLNVLVNRKSLARTSAQPGKTRTINYYHVDGFRRAPGEDGQEERIPHSLYLVDLPGYGYARAAEEIRAGWGRLIERYLKTSGQLRQVFLLVDIRHEPGAGDVQMYDWICHNGFKPVIIATKLDKLKRSQVSRQLGVIRKKLGMGPEGVLIPFSAETKQGRDEIWKQILLPEISSGPAE